MQNLQCPQGPGWGRCPPLAVQVAVLLLVLAVQVAVLLLVLAVQVAVLLLVLAVQVAVLLLVLAVQVAVLLLVLAVLAVTTRGTPRLPPLGCASGHRCAGTA
jgi:hypothetical protein